MVKKPLVGYSTNQLTIPELASGQFEQRHEEKAMTWRHPSDGGFDHSRYFCALVPDRTASMFLDTHHYLGGKFQSRYCLGMFDREERELVGVAVLGNGSSKATLANAFPNLVESRDLKDDSNIFYRAQVLTRFCIRDSVPANGESWFLSKLFGFARSRGILGVVAFSDPMARSNHRGELIFVGHVGRMYQIIDMLHTGRSSGRWRYMDQGGRLIEQRSISKAQSGEQGAAYAERDILAASGGRVRDQDEDRSEWLKEQLASPFIRHVKHPGNLRYVKRLAKWVELGQDILEPPLQIDIDSVARLTPAFCSPRDLLPVQEGPTTSPRLASASISLTLF